MDTRNRTFCLAKKDQGFTLLEIMIVIGLLGLIALIAFPDYKSLRDDQTLYTEAAKLKSDLRYMQQIAFDTQNICRMTYGSSSSKSYTLQLDSSANPLKSGELQSNVTFQEAGTVSFGGDGIPNGSSFPFIITLVKNNLTVDIKIYSGGKIEIL